MSSAFDPFNLLILAVAVVVLWRLRSVLGTRTGHERRYDPYSPAETAEKKPPLAGGDDNVISMPSRKPSEPLSDAAEAERVPAWKGVAEPGTPLAEGLEKIAEADSEFEAAGFLEGAKGAYEMVVAAFAEGDRKTLKPLLSRDVYDGFSEAIGRREQAGETLDTKLVGIEKTELVDAELHGRRANVTVRFTSKMITATRDRQGEVIEGDATRIREVTDVWTFERDVTSRDPNWTLITTEETA